MRQMQEMWERSIKPAADSNECHQCEVLGDKIIDMQAEINILKNKLAERDEYIRRLHVMSSTATNVCMASIHLCLHLGSYAD